MHSEPGLSVLFVVFVVSPCVFAAVWGYWGHGCAF